MLVEVIAALGLMLPGLLLCEALGFKQSMGEKLAMSYMFSTSLMLAVLFVGGIFGLLWELSYVLLIVVLTSGIGLIVVAVIRRRDIRREMSSLLSELTATDLLVPILTAMLLSIYVAVLLSRPILDSDVVQFYLPIAREISSENGLTYATGYDYNIILKPIGGALIYAWTYALAGSIEAESFRLMPLVPVTILVGLLYELTKQATGSKGLASLATAIFLVLPFHDRLLLFNAFYPDLFYYPLVFLAMMHVMKYVGSRERSNLVWIGLELGVASLLKAQSIYVLIAVLAVIVATGLRNRRLSVLVMGMTPFIILFPNLIAESIQRSGFRLSLSGLTAESFLLLCFLGLVLVVVYYILFLRNDSERCASWLPFRQILSGAFLLLIPFGVTASLWYLSNWLRFGSLLYTSSIGLPNYDWAVALLRFLSSPSTFINGVMYVGYFCFMFFDPAVLGYIWLVPCLLGILHFSKSASLEMRVLLVLGMALATLIFSQTVYLIADVGAPTYNPRDILLLTPMLAILAASGIASVSATSTRSSEIIRFSPIAFLLVAFYGCLSYVHSVIVWFVGVNMPRVTVPTLAEAIVSVFGLSLQETSFQLGAPRRILFVYEEVVSVLLVSLTAGLPLLFLLVKRFWKTRWHAGQLVGGGSTLPSAPPHGPQHFRGMKLLGLALSLAVLLSVIAIPRATIYIQAGNQAISDYPLKATYGRLEQLISAGNLGLAGGILTYMAPDGLPYYFPYNQLIDLKWAANLAALKTCLTASSPLGCVIGLRERGIDYLLIDSGKIRDLDLYLGSIFTAIVQNLQLSIRIGTFGSWNLFELGSHVPERFSFPLELWSVDLRYTNRGCAVFTSDSRSELKMDASGAESRVTVSINAGMGTALSEYEVLVAFALWTANAKISSRIFLYDNACIELIQCEQSWTQSCCNHCLDGLFPYVLTDVARMTLMRSDLQPSELCLWERSLIRVV